MSLKANPADVPGHKKHKNHKERKIHKKCVCEVNYPVGEAKFGVMWLQVPFFVPFVLFVAKRVALSRLKANPVPCLRIAGDLVRTPLSSPRGTPWQSNEPRVGSGSGRGAFLLVLAAVILGQWPVWQWFVARLDDGTDEPWGLVALLAAGALILVRRSEIQITRPRWVVLTLLLVVQWLLPPGTPALIHAVFAMAMIGICCAGGRGWLPLLGLLLLALPVMASLQFFAGYWLRLVAGMGSVGLLRLLGQEVTLVGTLLHWHGEIIAIDPPCSGVRMLWFGGFLYCLSGAWHRTPTGRFLLGGMLAMGLLIVANLVRATLLFYKESGLVAMPDSAHEGIGLVVFGVACLGIVAIPTWRVWVEENAISNRSRKPVPQSWTYGLMLLAISLSVRGPEAPAHVVASSDPLEWPSSEQGVPLLEIPIPDEQIAFLKTFPGSVRAFAWGNELRIYRWVRQPTRQVHPAADCYRSSGWNVTLCPQIQDADGRRWSVTRVESGEQSLEVLEQIRDGSGQYWTEPSQWYWEALLEKTTGPWWVVSRIRPSA